MSNKKNVMRKQQIQNIDPFVYSIHIDPSNSREQTIPLTMFSINHTHMQTLPFTRNQWLTSIQITP